MDDDGDDLDGNMKDLLDRAVSEAFERGKELGYQQGLEQGQRNILDILEAQGTRHQYQGLPEE